MPSMRKTNKRQLNLSVTLELYHKLEKEKQRLRQQYVSDTALSLLEEATRNIELTSKDYEQIAREVAENERKRKAR